MNPFVQKLEVSSQSISDRLTRWVYQNRWPFLITLLVAAGVHYPIYANHLQNSDSALLGSLYMAEEWETQQGRWGLRIIDMLRGGIDLAPLSAFLMIVLYSAAGILLTRVFEVRSRLLRVLIPLLIVCAPYVAEVERYHYCSAAYALSFLLAISAVVFVWCNNSTKSGEIFGALCLLFSLSIYQANLGVAAGLCIMLLVLAVLQNRSWLLLLRRFIIMGMLGLVGYCLMLKLALILYNTSLYTPYSGGILMTLKNAPRGIAYAYQDFVAYFMELNTIAQNYYGQRPVYVVLAVLTLIVLVHWLGSLEKKSSMLTAIIFLLLIPVAVNITDIINTNVRIQLRMAGALILVAPFCLVILEKGVERDKNHWRDLLIVGGLLCTVLLRGYIVQINNDSMVMLAEKNKVVNLANRICLQLEQNSDYLAGAEVCIVGEAQEGWYKDVSPLYGRASSLAQEGIFLSDPVFNSDGWKSLCWEELGVRLNWCSDERILKLCATDNFQNMPIYPQTGSIQTIDGVVVVKVADVQ